MDRKNLSQLLEEEGLVEGEGDEGTSYLSAQVLYCTGGGGSGGGGGGRGHQLPLCPGTVKSSNVVIVFAQNNFFLHNL